jgi:uncharacterized protein YkwD
VRPALQATLLSLTTAVLSLLLVAGHLLAPPPASATTTREARLLADINHTRAVHGLRPLHARAGLMDYARSHARSMARHGYLFHTANFNVICCWSAIAENVGVNGTVHRAHRAFMRSAPHRANILNPRLRGVGVGVIRHDGHLWVTEIFRRHA